MIQCTISTIASKCFATEFKGVQRHQRPTTTMQFQYTIASLTCRHCTRLSNGAVGKRRLTHDAQIVEEVRIHVISTLPPRADVNQPNADELCLVGAFSTTIVLFVRLAVPVPTISRLCYTPAFIVASDSQACCQSVLHISIVFACY
jgi:hypothetical protein